MKKYLLPAGLLLVGISALVSFGMIGSTIAEDGTLREPFWLIPVGVIALLLGLIVGLGISIWTLCHSPKKFDKGVFAFFLILSFLISFYVVASMTYLTEKSLEEIAR